jgi:hypothetical protein
VVSKTRENIRGVEDVRVAPWHRRGEGISVKSKSSVHRSAWSVRMILYRMTQILTGSNHFATIASFFLPIHPAIMAQIYVGKDLGSRRQPVRLQGKRNIQNKQYLVDTVSNRSHRLQLLCEQRLVGASRRIAKTTFRSQLD